MFVPLVPGTEDDFPWKKGNGIEGGIIKEAVCSERKREHLALLRGGGDILMRPSLKWLVTLL